MEPQKHLLAPPAPHAALPLGELTLAPEDGFVRIAPAPSLGLRELLRHVESMAPLVRCGALEGMLIDMRRLSHLGSTEQVLLGHHCGLHLRGARIAVLVAARDGQGQRAARSLGLDMRCFEDEAWALEWLREEG